MLSQYHSFIVILYLEARPQSVLFTFIKLFLVGDILYHKPYSLVKYLRVPECFIGCAKINLYF